MTKLRFIQWFSTGVVLTALRPRFIPAPTTAVEEIAPLQRADVQVLALGAPYETFAEAVAFDPILQSRSLSFSPSLDVLHGRSEICCPGVLL